MLMNFNHWVHRVRRLAGFTSMASVSFARPCRRSIAQPVFYLCLALHWIAVNCLLPSEAAERKIGDHTFTFPDGFEIELVAGPPLVDRPLMADFDESGRLYVADSSGANYNVKQQLVDKPHRIVRLDDTDQDGRFDQRTIFADQMMFPEGILWFDGAVYSGAPPTIWKLEDTNADGVADRRTEWFNGGTLTGCANDLHGPYLGPDGWIYWCKGAFAKQTHERPGRPVISDSAAHIFRCRSDGSEFDSLMSGGMDNPVEVAFTAAGEAIFSTTFYTRPQGGQRDALVHAIYGGVYPKVHGVLDELVRTGDLMPALTHLGPAVPCGLMRYRHRAFGADFTDNLFSTQFNLHKVQRHILEPNGATFKTRDIDFLASDNPDFHPTDVLEDADGSLLVIDTGGWYKICCPTSQLAKPDVLGAIYRIRKVGAPKVEDPRGRKLEWAAMKPAGLAKLLADPRPAVRSQAIAQLAKRGPGAVPALRRMLKLDHSVQARRNAVWALTRLDGANARASVRAFLTDQDETVRQAAVHSVAMHRDADALPQLLNILKSEPLHLQRGAATALGRIGDSSAIAGLLAASAPGHERPLEHSLIYALIEIGDRAATEHGLREASPFTRRAALIALDQMRDGGLTASSVAPLLSSTNQTLKQTAIWIAGRHPDWGKELAGYFRDRLAGNLSEAERTELQDQLAQFASDSAIQELMAAQLRRDTSSAVVRELVLRAIARTALKSTPRIWAEPLRQSLGDRSESVVRWAVAAVRALPVAKTNAIDFSDGLRQVALDPSRSADLRLNALSGLSSGMPLDRVAFDFLLTRLAPDRTPVDRTTAAGILGRARLTDDQLIELTEAIMETGPLEISRLLTAFDHPKSETIGLKLLGALERSKGLVGLRPDMVRPVMLKYPDVVQQRGQELLRQMNRDLDQQKAKLESLESSLQRGDIRRGQAIFNGTRAACSTCHQVGYLGGKVGPDLTRIGSVRTERDLLEAILFPSASFVRSYEPMIVSTKDGEEYGGVLRQESTGSLVLVSGAGTEQRLEVADVMEMRPGSVSTMPEGLDQQMSEQELADLIAFLKSLK